MLGNDKKGHYFAALFDLQEEIGAADPYVVKLLSLAKQMHLL